MYRCQLCQAVVPPGTPAHRVVLERRVKQYPYRPRANVVVIPPKDGKKKKTEYRDDPGGEGAEIVKEVTACPQCAAKV